MRSMTILKGRKPMYLRIYYVIVKSELLKEYSNNGKGIDILLLYDRCVDDGYH